MVYRSGHRRTCGLGRADCDLARRPARGCLRRVLPAAPWDNRYCPFLAQVRLGRSRCVYQPHRRPCFPARATPAEAIAGAGVHADKAFAGTQSMLRPRAGVRNAEERLQRRGHAPTPEISAQRASLEQQLDTIAAQIRQGEAWLAARAVVDGGDPLTPSQAEQLLLAIKASDASLALYREAPEEMTVMLNHSLTTLEGSFEVRIGLIATHRELCQRVCQRGAARRSGQGAYVTVLRTIRAPSQRRSLV